MSLLKHRLQKLEEKNGGPLSTSRMHLALVRSGQSLADARAKLSAEIVRPGEEICFVRFIRPGDVTERGPLQ